MYVIYKYRKGKLLESIKDVESIENANTLIGWVRRSNRKDATEDFILVEIDTDRIIKLYHGTS